MCVGVVVAGACSAFQMAWCATAGCARSLQDWDAVRVGAGSVLAFHEAALVRARRVLLQPAAWSQHS